MAQPSVAQYFNSRKRAAIDDYKLNQAKKVLVLDRDDCPNNNELISPFPQDNHVEKKTQDADLISQSNKIVYLESKQNVTRKIKAPRTNGVKKTNSRNIQELLNNMNKERCVTPPNEPKEKPGDDLAEIRKKISKSTKLKELKASINRFNEASSRLKEAEKRTAEVSSSPKLKSFNTLEFEVPLSPQKALSPEKPYLSPRKETTVRRNLLQSLSPVKSSTTLHAELLNSVPDSPSKLGLTLPFKYRTLAEIFRAIDTVSQILYNRKETITFKRLQPAVEKLLKRNLHQRHIAQIKHIYPDAYNFKQEKLLQFGAGIRQHKWELTITPNIQNQEHMTAETLLVRRRKLFSTLIDRVKDYHQEFLASLTPPMLIEKDQITRWHPEFDIERVPDIELADVPQPPVEEKFTTGQEVLEKACQMFHFNSRMEQALAKLKESRQAAETNSPAVSEAPSEPTSLLKGIPKALLEKVRQKQAAKALISMTRSVDKDKEVQLYARLPELARLTRNLFVAEKKGVLPLDSVVDKLGNSYKCFLTKTDMEDHLKTIAKEVPNWLVFHNIRGCVFLKLAKNADVSVVLNKLEKLAKEKSES